MLGIGVLVSGSGSNLQAIIDAVAAKRLGCSIKVVISDKPGAYALERARKHNIPVALVTKESFPSREAFDAEMVRLLKDYGVGLVVMAGFMRLISSVMLNAFPMRILNIHPSLLPSFPGLDVQRKAVEHGVKLSGCTVHFVDAGLDSGPIVIQAAVPVLDGDTAETLSKRILREEHRIYPQAVQLYAEGRLKIDGRRVIVTESPASSESSLENPPVTIFD